MKKVINSKMHQKLLVLFSTILAGNTLYVSGQLPIDPKTGLMPTTIEEQTKQSLDKY